MDHDLLADQDELTGFMHPRRVVRASGLEPGMKVAELGAGSGMLVRAAAEAVGSAGRVYAVDVQQELLKRLAREMAKAGLSNVETIWADFEEPHGTKLADKSVDVVFMSNVLFQCDRKHAALEEAKRVLAVGGILTLVDWSDSFGGVGPHPSRVVTPQMARQLLADVGFSIVRDFVPGSHHYGFVCHVAHKK